MAVVMQSKNRYQHHPTIFVILSEAKDLHPPERLFLL
jgi:hypothetical protein